MKKIDEIKHILIAYKSTNIGLHEAANEILILFAVSVAKRTVCPICWQPLEDGIVKNMCVNDDCPLNGGQTER